MATPGTPNNVYLTQANRQVLLQWDLTAGATSYSVQRSLDGVNYSVVASPTANYYLDTAVSSGTKYYYDVAAVNVSGIGLYSAPQSITPTPTGEFSLGGIRLAAQQRADRIASQFVTLPEWNSYINQAMFELYDILITAYEDYYIATPAQFFTQNPQTQYPLPDGITSFYNGITAQPGYIAPPIYKLTGVDLGLNTASNAWVTVKKFNFIDRNRFIYPNTASTIYGVFNLQYRMLGNFLEFIPAPSSNQPIRLWYVPRLQELLQDTDITTTGISGWIEYVIVRAAKYALDKEESDTTKLDAQLIYLKGRIEEAAQNRDAGMPDTIADVRGTSWNGQGGNGWGPQGSSGGW